MEPIDARRPYLISIALSMLAILAPALYNNFPFLYSDSGTYLYVGFTGLPSEIRPVLYGWFLRWVSMKDSLWLVIFVQAWIVSWSINRFVRTFFPATPALLVLGMVTLLTFASGIGVTTGMIMPDFLTPVMILLSILLLYQPVIRRWESLLQAFLLFFALASHHSHPYILFCVLIGMVILLLIPSFRQASFFPFRRMMLVTAIAVLGFFAIPAFNYVQGGEWVRSHSSNIFLVGRMNEMGLLKPFLAQACDKKGYGLCTYQHEIPEAFLWDGNSPVNKDGGWIANNRLYGEIVRDFFSEPRYAKKFVIKSLETVVQQLYTFDLCVIVAERDGGFPYRILEQNVPEFLPPYKFSKQYRYLWSNEVFDFLQKILVLASLLWLCRVFLFRPGIAISDKGKYIGLVIVLGLLANAFICASISTIDPRFQARLIWLLPLYALLLAIQLWSSRQYNQERLITTNTDNSRRIDYH
ncbi:MAG: hypothetical protein NWR72_08125 [Bacteroidia bacterium]|nr:hypothetical protein [Bacteroidia bacterium]